MVAALPQRQAGAVPSGEARGIYLHIPYCRTLCPYCDFVKARTRGDVPGPFVEALLREIVAYNGPRPAQSIFFGGGTPSLLSDDDLRRVLDALGEAFDLDAPEVTLEANPDDVTRERAAAWRAAGVNRVSLGVQSFDDACLRKLGRRHGAREAEAACRVLAGEFDTWNLDLIFGAPPVETWPATLEKALALAPPHLAAYGLTYEEGTPFYKRRHEAIEEDLSLALYQQAEQAFAAYDHYEVSNWARPGHHSRHNLVYWRNGEYAGFGTGAYSYLGGVRARNHPGLDDYLRTPGEKTEALPLSEAEQQVETLIQHFRLRAGLSIAEYTARFGAPPAAHFGAPLQTLEARGLLESVAGTLRPTAEGFYLNNEIGLTLVG